MTQQLIDSADTGDGYARCAYARTLLPKAPEQAVALASDLLDSVALDSPLARDVVVTLAEALAAARRPADVVELERSCRGRWPNLTSVRYLAGLAHGDLGHAQEMVEAFEECVELGEDEGGVRVPGAGSYLPLFRLGLFAEASGARPSARACYARASIAAPDFAPAREALTALDARARRAPGVPPRLFSNDAVAMKVCRHGTMTYPIHDAFIGRALDLYGEWCEAELETLGALVEPGATVVDIGANIGSHTVYFARRVGPSGQVIAIEPQSFAFGLLSANLATNGLTNTRCLRAAVASTPGKARLPIVDPHRPANFGAVVVSTGSGGAEDATATEEVDATTVDALGLTSCALLKIDVEGMEVDVLSGARATIERCRPVLFVENNTLERSAEILGAIRALGYRAYWHIAPYYRADNHFGNPEDVFSPYQPESNLVCVPLDRALPGMLEAEAEDDFVKALTRAGALSARRVTGPPHPTVPAPGSRDARGPIAKKQKPLTVVACIPGREFSARFFDCWNAFVERCHLEGINLIVSRKYDAVVYYARNRVLGGDVKKGKKQAPWAGEVDYDYMLWIDSDIVFRFEDFQALLARKVDLVAGLYLMADNARFSAVETMNEETFRTQGQFEFLTPEALSGKTDLVPVDYCGFGFVLARRGVFERVEYPWFRPIYVELPDGMTEFTSEDVGFCMEAKRAGLSMHVDPCVVVGHEKPVVLSPNKAA